MHARFVGLRRLRNHRRLQAWWRSAELLWTVVLRAQGAGRVIPAEARGAWREVEARLRPYVARRVASPTDIDDVIQETFVRMHRGLATLEVEERFGPWVYRVAASAIADHRRARARHPLVA